MTTTDDRPAVTHHGPIGPRRWYGSADHGFEGTVLQGWVQRTA